MSQFDSPTPAEFDTTGEPPAWPKVVGIISIVWASIGLVCNLCNMLGGVMQGAFMGMVPPEQQEQMKAQMAANSSPLAIGASALSLLVSALLLVAGIQTLRRRANGRMLHLVWVVAALIAGVIGGYAGWIGMQASVNQTLQNDPNAQQMAGAVNGIAIAMFGCIMLLTFAWPLFCAVWFGAMGKRPEVGAKDMEPII